MKLEDSNEKVVEGRGLFDENYDVEVPRISYDNDIVQEFLNLDYSYDLKDKNSNRYIDLIKEFYKVILDNKGRHIQIKTNYGDIIEGVVGEDIKHINFNIRPLYDYQIDTIKDFEKIKDLYIFGDEIFKMKDLISKSDLLSLKLITMTINSIFQFGEIYNDYLEIFEKLSNDKKLPLLKDTLKDIREIDFNEFINFKHCFSLIERYYKLEEDFYISKEYSEYYLNYYMYLLSSMSLELSNPTESKASNGLFFNNLKVKRENSKAMCCACYKDNIINRFNEPILVWGLNKGNLFFDDDFAFKVFLNDINTRSLEELSISPILYFISKDYLEKDFLYKLLFDTYENILDFVNNTHCQRAPRALDVEKGLLHDLYIYLEGHLKECNGREDDIYKVGSEIFMDTFNYMIDFESKRSKEDTKYTKKLMSLGSYPGIHNFAKILSKMGNLKFTKNFKWEVTGKGDVFSNIIRKSIPEKDLTQDKFNSIIHQYDISKERLVEAGIYNINYISFIESYLKIDGLSELAYYFFYHTKYEAYLYSNEEKDRLKKYSNIDSYDLKQGRMDVLWFNRAYKKVGKKDYELALKYVKNITSSPLHKRSEYCGDGVLGKLKITEVEKEVLEKRNLSMIVAYGVIPLKGDKDKGALRRYLNIQKFLKGSSEFGPKKRKNERVAADHCLGNLAATYGVSRERFQWIMDILSDSFMKVFSPQQIEDITIHIDLDNIKTPKLAIIKKGKSLKSVPANLKKNENIQDINEIKKELKDKYNKCLETLEKAMDNKEIFTLKDIQNLYKHPIVSRVIKDILFTKDDKVGFVVEGKLICLDEEVILTDKNKLKITHPAHLDELNILERWQKYVKKNKIKQPFEQVFKDIKNGNNNY